MYGIQIRTNARHAKQIAATLSPDREFVPIATGVFFMEANSEVHALHDYDFIVSNRLLIADRVLLIDRDEEN